VEFLEDNQICKWAEQHGLLRGERFEVRLPELPSKHHAAYADGRRSGRERAAASELITGLGSWDECVVWIKLWGVWPSGEDWPKFYGWRGALGERRSLETAPGHRFDPGETLLLAALLTLVMENAWDADVLCSVRGRADKVRARISHDEWFELLGLPSELAESAGQQPLI
jgi:hypothetical protein